MPVMLRLAVVSLATATAAFHLWAAGVAPFTALVQRPVHLALMASLGFLGIGIRGRLAEGERPSSLDWGWVAVAAASCSYLAWQHEALVRRAGTATSFDLVAGLVALVVVVELARRATGPGLVAVVAAALVYSQVGPWLPGVLGHRGYGPRRIIEHLYLSTEGIWGIPLGVSADFVYLFILFGALLDRAGGGLLLIALARRLTGRSRGGPAKTAALASAFMGSLSGSAVANVVTTGAVTIPLMRRAGFAPYLAAAIEAAASTGGQLMPPVMGAGAFVLATWTNIPYATVAMAAILPALLYYVALLAAIHFAARRDGIEPEGDADPTPVAGRLHLLLPLVVIVLLLALGRSPMRAAFWGVLTAAAAAFAGRETRPDLRGVGQMLVGAAGGAVQVAAACAAAGIVVGVATLTGIGLRMSEAIVTLSGGHLPVALVLTALGSIVLGMGLPTTAAYVVLAALGAPALVELGAPLLSAHLFIFYFGCISNVTPPVSLAAYAAAGLADAPPLRTAFTAMSLAAAGFLVPFAFVLGPSLVLGAGPVRTVVQVSAGLIGALALAAAGAGYHRHRLSRPERLLLVGAAVLLLWPGWETGAVGAALVALSFFRAPGGRS